MLLALQIFSWVVAVMSVIALVFFKFRGNIVAFYDKGVSRLEAELQQECTDENTTNERLQELEKLRAQRAKMRSDTDQINKLLAKRKYVTPKLILLAIPYLNVPVMLALLMYRVSTLDRRLTDSEQKCTSASSD